MLPVNDGQGMNGKLPLLGTSAASATSPTFSTMSDEFLVKEVQAWTIPNGNMPKSQSNSRGSFSNTCTRFARLNL